MLEQPAQPDPDWKSAQPDPARGNAPHRIFNIGSGTCLPLQPGDVPTTASDVHELAEATGHTPSVTVEEGVHRFVKWYKEYYGGGKKTNVEH